MPKQTKISNLFQMLRDQPQNNNHPKKGARIKVEPIRDLGAIVTIKHNLRNQPRNLCLFTLGINTAYRASELLSITVGQVRHLKVGGRLDVKQQKTQKYRAVTLNNNGYNAIQNWLEHHPNPTAQAPLFLSYKRPVALTVSAVNNLTKAWCTAAGLSGNFGSHTLRKSWGYHQRMKGLASLALLMEAFGHSTEAQTLAYLCIQSHEIQDLYTALEL
ncbi:MAG: tyrosine-type recombinase/integrase [Psychrosphaera sp.]|nr:tyrosine-type recombinase/integrase [Psychrosphaera sp.]